MAGIKSRDQLITSIRQRRAGGTRSAMRAFNVDGLTKMVSGLRRVLLEAKNTAELAVEDLTDATYNGDAIAALGDAPGMAADYMEQALPHIQKASQLCAEAKSVLMQTGAPVPAGRMKAVFDLDGWGYEVIDPLNRIAKIIEEYEQEYELPDRKFSGQLAKLIEQMDKEVAGYLP